MFIRLQNNLAHLPTKIRLVAELADVRILALGMHTKPIGPFYVNDNALDLLNRHRSHGKVGRSVVPGEPGVPDDCICHECPSRVSRLASISVSASHPIIAPNTGDQLKLESRHMQADGRRWVGSMMSVSVAFQVLTLTCVTGLLLSLLDQIPWS